MDANERSSSRIFDRRLFAAAALLFPLIVIAGFARTYYLKGFFDVPPLASLMVHFHGIVMTLWVALFITQVWLISSRRIKLHQKMGFAGIGLAILIMIVSFLTAVRAAKFGSPATPPGIPQLAFLLIPLTDLLMFAILFGTAIYFRKRPAEHKRLMLLTAINFLPPAVARIPSASLQALGPLWFFGLPTLLTLLAIVFDSRQNRRINKIFLAGTLLLIASYIVRLALMGTPAWMRVAEWLTSWAA